MKQLNIKEIQQLQLEMLIHLDKFCHKNNINYFIGCGTLAGAVLKKGFFSWDDDIDVLMKREDYENFLRLYDNNKYKLLSCNNKNYYYPYAKMINTQTIAYECKNNIPNYGVFIDIFPLDNTPNKLYITLLKPLRILMMSQWGCYLDDKSIIIKIIYKVLSIITKPLPNNFFAKILNKICKKGKGKLMGVLVFHKYIREIMSKEIFDEKIKIEFENHKFNTIKRYEEYLNNLYIDYHKEDKKEGHKHFKAYWK